MMTITRSNLYRTILAALVLAGSLLVHSAQPAAAAFLGNNGKIAFMSSRDGNFEIYTMNPDGSGQTNLTNNLGFDANPAWSPDGSKIAFQSNRDGNFEIYVMNADGSNPTNVTDAPGLDANPDWQPDNTPPETNIASGSSGAVDSTSATFIFSSNEAGSSFECSLDGATFEPCSSPKDYTALSSKAHTFRVRAIDPAGNVDATPAVRPFTVDTIKPTVTSLKPTLGSTTRDRTPAIRATVRDSQTNLAKANVKLFVDGVSKTTFTYDVATDRLAFTPKSKLSLGKHVVRVVAQDAAGNLMAKSWSFKIVR